MIFSNFNHRFDNTTLLIERVLVGLRTRVETRIHKARGFHADFLDLMGRQNHDF